MSSCWATPSAIVRRPDATIAAIQEHHVPWADPAAALVVALAAASKARENWAEASDVV